MVSLAAAVSTFAAQHSRRRRHVPPFELIIYGTKRTIFKVDERVLCRTLSEEVVSLEGKT